MKKKSVKLRLAADYLQVCWKFFVRCSFANLFIGLFIFSLLSFQSSLYVLNTISLLDMRCTNILSKAGTCLFFPSTVTLAEKKILSLIKSNSSIFNTVDYAFLLYLGTHQQIQRHASFLLCFILKVILFNILYLVLWYILSYFSCKMWDQHQNLLFAYGLTIFPPSFFEKNILSSLTCLCIFVKK